MKNVQTEGCDGAQMVYCIGCTQHLDIALDFFCMNSHITLSLANIRSWWDEHNGNIGCLVFKQGVQNQKYFCLRINIPKANYWILRISVMASCQKLVIILNLSNISKMSRLYMNQRKWKKSWEIKLDYLAILNRVISNSTSLKGFSASKC